MDHNKNKTSDLQGHVRIIGGKWRSRRIFFPTVTELRPTPDRIRETLFNWLAPDILQANCLDLFAGSGVLGFEALSRGADSLVWVDKDERVVDAIQANVVTLGAQNCHVVHSTFPNIPIKQFAPFDLVFIDPPYARGLVSRALDYLVFNNLLSVKAKVYVERERSDEPLLMSPHFVIEKQKRTTAIEYFLLVAAQMC